MRGLTTAPIGRRWTTLTGEIESELKAQQRQTLVETLKQMLGRNVIQTGGPVSQTWVCLRLG